MSENTYNRIALSAHLLVESLPQSPEDVASARHVLHNHGTVHITLQPDSGFQSMRWLLHQKVNPRGNETESMQ